MDKTVSCKECKQQVFTNSVQYNGCDYCQDCYHRLFCIVCEKCEEHIPKADATELPDEVGVFRCSDCMGEDYFFCDSCDRYCLNDSGDVTVHNGDIICEACYDSSYHTCENCSDVFSDSDIIDHNGSYYCNNCFGNLFTECDSCGETVDNDYICCADGGYYCEACYPGETAELHDYSYTPDYNFYGTALESLYFGIELEIENEGGSDYLSDINETSRVLYAKSDSSLDNGIEIVSHPTTFEYFNENFDTVWKPILDSKNHGYRSYNTTTCGIHIHISKKAFSTLHLYKFMKFFYHNDMFLRTISQRNSEKMDEWASNGATGKDIVQKAKNKNGNKNRYSAINLQPHSTVEVRIFRGTLDVVSFRKNIEFLHALYHFTKTSGISELQVYLFKQYVTDNKKQYSSLYKFITKE